MKKTFFILALAALVISCAKEIQSETPAEGNKVTVRVSIPEEPLTKVSLTEAADFKSIALAWESSDQISINGEPFTIKEGFSAHEAEFEGTAPTGSTFNIIYPGKYTSLEAASARSYAGQVQTGNGSTAHLEYNAGLIGVSEYAEPKFDPDWAADKGGTLMQNAVVQMRLQLPDAATDATSVTLSASRAIFPTVNYGGSLVKEQTLTLKGVTLPANKILEAYMMVSAAGVEIQDGDELTVIVETSAGIFLRKITLQAQTWTGGGQYTLQLKVQDENIFEINTVDDLLEFRDGVNSGDMLWENVHAILKADLDLSSVSSWTPIGNGTFTPATSGSVKADWTEPAFKGTFDGGGHALKNLKANGTPAENTPYGLFGLLYRATVKDLVLGAETGDTGAFTVTPSGAMDAGVVAGAAYSSTVENITNYLPITLAENNSSARANLGMVGYLFGDVAIAPTKLSGLKNYGKITAAKGANANNNAVGFCVAGIGGFSNTAGSIINQVTGCTNYGDITAKTGRTAGVLGAANTRTAIATSDNRGNILNTFDGNSRIGGICVILGSDSSIKDCSNYGDVIATASGANLGGIACLLNNATVEVSGGGNHGRILCDQTTYRGTLIGNINTYKSVHDMVAGGTVGSYNDGDYQYIVLTEANYMSYIGKIKAGTEANVTTISFEAWDGYPAPPDENEIKISNATELLAFAERVNSGEGTSADKVLLTQDIDCSSITSWTPIGNATMSTWAHNSLTLSGNTFQGTFDGQNHAIKNLHMSFAPTVANGTWGFFGTIGTGATVKNMVFDASCSLHIETGVAGVFGVLAGMVNDATVENVKNYAPLTGGGTSSLASDTATGRVAVGGVIGWVMASTTAITISDLYNAGAIGVSESAPFTGGANVGAGANGFMLGGVVGFSSNTNNTLTQTLTNLVNDATIHAKTGRCSGVCSTANRYTTLKNCVNNGDVYYYSSGNQRIGNITCMASAGCVLEDCTNKGDLIASSAASAAGVVCLVGDNSTKVTRCHSLGATIVCTGVDIDTPKVTYAGVLYGQCNKTATFSGCTVSGKIGKTTDNLVTLTADNYFPFVGQAYATNTTINTTNIAFATE